MKNKQTKYPHVFQSIRVGNTTLKNRIITAPMYDFKATYDNQLTRGSIETFLPIAKGGASMVTMGSGMVNRVLNENGKCIPKVNNLFDVPRLADWSEAMQRFGAKSSIELYPIPKFFGQHEVLKNDDGIPMDFDINALTVEEIHDLQEDYTNAVMISMLAGYDFVTIHGAHCQLPAMFFSKAYNKRTDEYGTQTIESRSHFAIETLQRIRQRVGNNINIQYRISGSDMTPGNPSIEEVAEFAHLIEEYVDTFLISRGNLAVNKIVPYTEPTVYMEHGMNIDLAYEIKKKVSKPVAVAGAVTFEQAEEAIASGKVDLVALGRQLLADPECVNKAEQGREDEIRSCIRCNMCINRPHYEAKVPRCSVNPVLGRESDYLYVQPIEKKKKVVVVGGGPAGLEAARTLAKRGHDVVLMEASDKLGGTFVAASASSMKHDLRNYLDWSIREAKKYPNLKIYMNTRATTTNIKDENPDALIIAIGNEPIIPNFTCKNSNRVVLAQDVEEGKKEVKDNVLIAGAGLTGLESALQFLQDGKQVTVIDMINQELFGNGGTIINRNSLFSILENYSYTALGETRLIDVTDDEVIVETKGERKVLKADTVVLSLGYRIKNDEIESLSSIGCEYYIVGDANGRPANLFNAVASAYDAAMAI